MYIKIKNILTNNKLVVLNDKRIKYYNESKLYYEIKKQLKTLLPDFEVMKKNTKQYPVGLVSFGYYIEIRNKEKNINFIYYDNYYAIRSLKERWNNFGQIELHKHEL